MRGVLRCAWNQWTPEGVLMNLRSRLPDDGTGYGLSHSGLSCLTTMWAIDISQHDCSIPPTLPNLSVETGSMGERLMCST